ncbi:NADH dehydrogenase [ubiquinone] 1 alpha subcomplex assembly factor 4 [Rhinophrynus dorsalis]
MGISLTRALRNFNLENRAHRLVGKEKPTAAPRYPSTEDALEAVRKHYPDLQDKIHRKDDLLLTRLKEVYVDSMDPLPEVQTQVNLSEQEERRLPKVNMKREPLADLDVESIPKGKISILEALTVLNNHKHSPETWTAEKIAEEYNLELQNSKSLLEYFIPFNVKIIPPKDKQQIADT